MRASCEAEYCCNPSTKGRTPPRAVYGPLERRPQSEPTQGAHKAPTGHPAPRQAKNSASATNVGRRPRQRLLLRLPPATSERLAPKSPRRIAQRSQRP